MKVTADQINARIKAERFLYDGTLTLCIIELDNGFKATGESACVDPAEYNKATGETMARARAYSKLWAYFGFALAETMFLSTFSKAADENGAGATIPKSLQFGHDEPKDTYAASIE